MIIDITKIILTKDKTQQYACSLSSDSIDYMHGSFPINNSKPFELSIVNEGGKNLTIRGNTGLDITIPCDRCLTDVDVPFDIVIDKTLRISDDLLISDDGEITYINEGKLDVDRLLFDEILVDWPSKVLCKNDCKGICPKCGANLNTSPCDCDKSVIDPRMAKFQDVFKEFKEV